MSRVALVTGASRGIGRAIAVALAADTERAQSESGGLCTPFGRWTVVVNYQANAEAAARTLAEVEAVGGRGLTIQANIAAPAGRARLVQETMARCGRIDLLVNNAGMAPRQRVDLLQMTEASYDEVMAVNLKGPFFLTQLVARTMIEGPMPSAEGRLIINIGSLSAYTSSTNRAEYCLSKAGIAMMTRLYADRLAEHGINVYEIRPGIIETDMTSMVHEKYDRLIAAGLTPFRRWGRPEDVALAVQMLAAGRLPFSTGEVINVDGGFHLRRL